MSYTFVVPRLLKMRFHRYFLSYFPRICVPSDIPVTVVMPLAVKDIYRGGCSVHSLRKHLKHPITEIVIVGQDDEGIRQFCAQNQLVYINEHDVLPSTAHLKTQPSNFVRQQLIKLGVFDFIQADTVLVHDSDTYLMRDITYFSGEQQTLFLADEFTKSYEQLLFKFLGPIKRYHRSFVTHSMLFQRQMMAGLNNRVREHSGLSLIEAILANVETANAAGLSEFEIYGNYVHSFHKDFFTTRYWYNQKISPDTKAALEQLEARFWNMNSVSAHEH